MWHKTLNMWELMRKAPSEKFPWTLASEVTTDQPSEETGARGFHPRYETGLNFTSEWSLGLQLPQSHLPTLPQMSAFEATMYAGIEDPMVWTPNPSMFVMFFLFILLCTNGKIIDHWNCLHRKHTQWQATTSSLFCAKETCGWWMLGLISAETVWGCQCVISLAGLGHKLEFCAKPGGKQSLGQFSSFWHRPTTTGWLQVGIFSGQVWFYEYREQ